MSPAVKVVLINSSLLSIPTYCLSVYSVLDFVLNETSKVVRAFYWHKGGNGKAIHVVAWNRIMDVKN